MNRALRPDREVPAGFMPREPAEPWHRGAPDIGPSANTPPKFNLEPWSEISFDGGEEWSIKGILPRRGVAVVFGKPASFKSFVVSHMALCAALGWQARFSDSGGLHRGGGRCWPSQAEGWLCGSSSGPA